MTLNPRGKAEYFLRVDTLPEAPPIVLDCKLCCAGVFDRADHEHVAAGAHWRLSPWHQRQLFDDRGSVVGRRASRWPMAREICGEFPELDSPRFHHGRGNGWRSCRSPVSFRFPLLSTHFLLGAGFALVRIRSETRFLAECPRHLLGRFRANSLFVTSSVGLLIFATPTLYGGACVADLYIMMAGAVAVSAIGVLVVTKQSRGP
jgi:hypothetical protein